MKLNGFLIQKTEKRSRRDLLLSRVSLLITVVLMGAGYYFHGFSVKEMAGAAALGGISWGICRLRLKAGAVYRGIAGILIPAASFFLLELYTHSLSTLLMNGIKLNLILIYLLAAVVFLLTGLLSAADGFITVLVLLAGIGNYFVMLFRSSPIVPWDFYSILTAVSVADNYTFQISWTFVLITQALWCLLLISLHLDLKLRFLFVRTAGLAAVCTALGFFLSYLWDPDTITKEKLNDSLFISSNMYKNDGFLLAFTINLRYMSIAEPSGYQKEEAEALLQSQNTDEEEFAESLKDLSAEESSVPSETLPNVIIIMDECFSDLSVIGSLPVNQDYMLYTRSLLDGAENTVSGDVYVSVLGGNTANSEFEVMTGSSVKFFPAGSVVYQQYIHSSLDSMAEDLNALGYATVGMHPYKAGGWNRNRVYPYLGIGESFFINDITNKKKLRNYVSDESDFKEVLKLIRDTDEPLFLLNVTMQNHSAYGKSYDNFTPEISAAFQNTKSNKYLNNYLSLIYETDQALEMLIESLKESDEPVIVCFFGDHQPNDYVVKPIYQENGLSLENQTLEMEQNRHITPFFIWANYDIEEESNVKISSNFLGNLLLQTAGLPLNEYRTYLETVRERFPVLNSLGFYDADGNCRSYDSMTDEEQSLLDEYEKLQYYKMHDE